MSAGFLDNFRCKIITIGILALESKSISKNAAERHSLLVCPAIHRLGSLVAFTQYIHMKCWQLMPAIVA